MMADALVAPRTAAIIGLAVAARLITAAALGAFALPEVWEEGRVAEQLAAGGRYGYEWYGTFQEAFRAPAYPFLLAGLYALFGTHTAVALVLNALLGGATARCVSAAAEAVGGPRVGAVAAVLTALHPGLLVYAAKVHQLSLDAFLISALVMVIVRSRVPSPMSAVTAGALTGLVGLSRPTAVPFAIVAFGAWAFAGRPRPRVFVLATIGLLVASVFLGGWVVRNWVVVGVPTLSTGTGITLWIGFNEQATGSTMSRDGVPMLNSDPAMTRAIEGQSEIAQDRILTESAARYIAADPGRAIRSVGERFFIFWSFGPNAGLLYPAAWLILYVAYYAIVLMLAAYGAVSAWTRRRHWELSILTAALLTTALSQAIFYVDGRHRWTVEPLILVLSATGLVILVDKLVLARPGPWAR